MEEKMKRITYYNNGNIHESCDYAGNKRHGEYIRYYCNGTIHEICNYVNDEKNDGTVYETINYVNGKIREEIEKLGENYSEMYLKKNTKLNHYELYGNEEDSQHSNNRLAVVVQFDVTDENSKVVVKWDGEVSSIVIHESMANFKKVSLFGTRVLI